MEEGYYPDVAYCGAVPPAEKRKCVGCGEAYVSNNPEYCMDCWWAEVGSRPSPLYTGQSRGFASERIDPRPTILPIDKDPAISSEQRARLLYVKGGKNGNGKGRYNNNGKNGRNGHAKNKSRRIHIEPMDFM